MRNPEDPARGRDFRRRQYSPSSSRAGRPPNMWTIPEGPNPGFRPRGLISSAAKEWTRRATTIDSTSRLPSDQGRLRPRVRRSISCLSHSLVCRVKRARILVSERPVLQAQRRRLPDELPRHGISHEPAPSRCGGDQGRNASTPDDSLDSVHSHQSSLAKHPAVMSLDSVSPKGGTLSSNLSSYP